MFLCVCRICLAPPHCAALRWQWYTVGFLRATGGGWVHRVNYTSSPLVWFIALITVGSLKKEKGEEAYKIKKRLKVPQWQRERENCVRVHVGAVGLRGPDIVYCCKLLWGLALSAYSSYNRAAVTAPYIRAECPAVCWWNVCCRPNTDWPNMSWQRIASDEDLDKWTNLVVLIRPESKLQNKDVRELWRCKHQRINLGLVLISSSSTVEMEMLLQSHLKLLWEKFHKK